jgi:hypothetical protein
VSLLSKEADLLYSLSKNTLTNELSRNEDSPVSELVSFCETVAQLNTFLSRAAKD